MTRVMKLIPLAVLCAVIIAVPSVRANWIPDGVALCTAPGNQQYPTVASDGAGGAIVTWFDKRSGTNDIYAQRVSSTGVAQWTANGVALCTAASYQEYPVIASDGAGGAVVAWYDYRSGHNRVYAQKVDASGVVQWTTDGVALCPFPYGQQSPRIISDGAGGAIVAWWDYRGDDDIYAQRVGGSGTNLWGGNGVAVCTATGAQFGPEVIPDCAGGAIVTWEDTRGATANDVYAQRIGSVGTVGWTTDGVAICTAAGFQENPVITLDGAGGAIITWKDGRNVSIGFDIYAQRVSASGIVQWTTDGVVVCAAAEDQEGAVIASDGDGGAFVAWQDGRSGSENADIYAQRMDSSGVARWTTDGVVICSETENQSSPVIVSDGVGGAIVAWCDHRNGSDSDIYAQRVDSTGAVRWAANGVPVCTATGDQHVTGITLDGMGGAVVSWVDRRDGNDDIYAQRVDAAGHTVTATLLHDWSVSVRGAAVEIDWTLSQAGEGIELFVLRAGGASNEFVEIAPGSSGGSGTGAITRSGLSFAFTDESCVPGQLYRYRVDVRDGGVRTVLFETGEVEAHVPGLALHQNYPNPFNPSTTIRYDLGESGTVSLEIYDVGGNLVRRLVRDIMPAGSYAVEWNGLDDRGSRAGSGVYYCRLRAGKETISCKVILLR